MVVGYDAGVTLVRDEGVAALAFTGSQAAGLALWRIANERQTVIPTYAEMSTVNPVVVTRAAAATRMEEIAEGFVGSFTLGSDSSAPSPVWCSLQREQRQPTPSARFCGRPRLSQSC